MIPYRTSPRRNAYTLIELLVVLALILVVGAVVVPTLDSMMQDTNPKGAADLCVARLADARSYAIDEGRAYRFSCNPEGTKIRVSVDEIDGSGTPLESPELPPHTKEEPLPTGVILSPDARQSPGDDGWITLVTYLPDGTCRESMSPEFQLKEPGTVTYFVQVRSLTGAVDTGKITGAK